MNFLDVTKPIEEGGAFGVMAAYNKLNGFPGLVNPINKTIVKEKWGGRLVCSDGGAFSQVCSNHKFTKSHSETLALAIKAGIEEGFKNANIVYDSGRDVVVIKNGLTGRYLQVQEDGSVRICADKEKASQFEKYDWVGVM